MKINKNIKMPEKKSKYPFANMEVGDSVFFAGKDTRSKEYISAMRFQEKSKQKIKFSGRSVEGGLRIWRIK